jgi:hypothetical protein
MTTHTMTHDQCQCDCSCGIHVDCACVDSTLSRRVFISSQVANLVEHQARQHSARCTTILKDLKAENDAKLAKWWTHFRLRALREAERKRREAEEAAQRPAAPPPPPRPRRNSTRKHGGRVGPNATRTGRRWRKGSGREASTSSERLVTEPPPGAQGRQECFTVYD